jgi:hypothetical protein
MLALRRSHASLEKFAELDKRERVLGVAEQFRVDARTRDDHYRIFTQFSQDLREFD